MTEREEVTDRDEVLRNAMPVDKTGVHQTHCCGKHGCKYGKNDCPVAHGGVVQEYACPYCNSTKYLDEQIARLQEEREWSAQLEARGLTVCGEEEY